MTGMFETIRAWVRLAWWDGSCLGLRLHRLPVMFEVMFDEIATDEGRPARVRVSA